MKLIVLLWGCYVCKFGFRTFSPVAKMLDEQAKLFESLSVMPVDEKATNEQLKEILGTIKSANEFFTADLEALAGRNKKTKELVEIQRNMLKSMGKIFSNVDPGRVLDKQFIELFQIYKVEAQKAAKEINKSQGFADTAKVVGGLGLTAVTGAVGVEAYRRSTESQNSEIVYPTTTETVAA